MEEKELYCLGLQYKYLFEQGKDEKPFDPFEACDNCKFNDACEYKWHGLIQRLKETVGITVSIVRKVPFDKSGRCCKSRPEHQEQKNN